MGAFFLVSVVRPECRLGNHRAPKALGNGQAGIGARNVFLLRLRGRLRRGRRTSGMGRSPYSGLPDRCLSHGCVRDIFSAHFTGTFLSRRRLASYRTLAFREKSPSKSLPASFPRWVFEYQVSKWLSSLMVSKLLVKRVFSYQPLQPSPHLVFCHPFAVKRRDSGIFATYPTKIRFA